MKYFTILLTSLIFVACKDEPKVKVEKWHPLEHTVDEYQKLQPGRPILVFFTVDWNTTGTIIRTYLEEPRNYDLLTQYQVLPLVANYSSMDGLEYKELMRLDPEHSAAHSNRFLLRLPDGEQVWFATNELTSDATHEMLDTNLKLRIVR